MSDDSLNPPGNFQQGNHEDPATSAAGAVRAERLTPWLVRRFHHLWRRAPKRTLLVFTILLVASALFLIHPLWEATPDTVKEIMITLTVVAFVHLLDRIFLFRDTEHSIKLMTRNIIEQSAKDHLSTQRNLAEVTERQLKEVTDKTVKPLQTIGGDLSRMISTASQMNEQAMREVSASLNAMKEVGVVKLYSTREEAGLDILRDLNIGGEAHIRLMGISLNDFVQGRGSFGIAWNDLKARVKEAAKSLPESEDACQDAAARASQSRFRIQLLLIHPFCLGAQLRSRGESRGTDAIKSRLMTDVQSVGEEIAYLQTLAPRQMSIECRLYQLPPTLFLCSVNKVCYMQPYFFWNKRQVLPVPVFKFITDHIRGDDDQIAFQLNQHFDLIWAKASISLEEFRMNNVLGVDKGMRQAGAVNVFLEKSESRKRIHQMLKHAKSEISIQGITLQSFFSPGDLYQEIARLILGGRVRIRVLVLDPDSEQAELRSFRERLFVAKDENLEMYRASGRHKDSALYMDATKTIREANNFLEHLVKKMATDGNWKHRVQVRKYKSAPACFMLQVDDRVLVEQYHYGKAKHIDQPEMEMAILGKEMPVFEFRADQDDLYDTSEEVRQRQPFQLLKDHFEFAFDNAENVLCEAVLEKLDQCIDPGHC